MHKNDDLASAVRDASSAVEKMESSESLSRHRRSRTQIGNGPASIMIVVASMLVVSLLWESNYHQSQSELDTDLLNIVLAAQESVEAAKTSTGDLPPTIPNVALAGVVSYELSGTEYRLVLQAKNRIARIDRDGSLHIEGVPDS